MKKRSNRHLSYMPVPKSKKRFAVALTVATIIPIAAYGAWGDTNAALALANFETSLAELVASVTADVAAVETSLVTTINNNTNQLTGAIKVATQQEAATANQIATAENRSAQVLSNAMQAQSQRDVIQDTLLQFGATGQGYNACQVIAENKNLNSATQNLPIRAAQMVTTTDNAPGRLVDSKLELTQLRVQKHRDKFCTEAEAAQGLCTLSALPGGDTNAALLFKPVAQGSLESQAREQVRTNILGDADLAISPNAGRSPAGQAYLMALNQKTSLMAFPAFSLATIDAANLQTEVDENGNPVSPNQLIDAAVERYYGGEKAKQWQATMLNQEPRGLLVELARVGGLTVWMHQQDYEQNQRIEANLAALVLSNAKLLKAKTDIAYAKTSSSSAGKAIPIH